MLLIFGGEGTKQPGILRSVIVNMGGEFCHAKGEMYIERKDAAALVIPCTPVGLLDPFDEQLWDHHSVAVCGGFTGTEVLQDCVLYRNLRR